MAKDEIRYNEFKKAVLKDLLPGVASNESVSLQGDGNKDQVLKEAPLGRNKLGEEESRLENNTSHQTPGNASQAPEPEGTKVETRGRHKRDCTCSNCVSKRGGHEQAQSSLDSTLGKYKRVESKPSTTQSPALATATQNLQQVDLSKFISGALFLILLDALMPKTIILLAGFIDDKYKGLDTALLKLEPKEKKELEPLADEIVKVIFGYVNPMVAFLIVTAVMYGSKLMGLDETDFEDAKEKREKKLAAKRKEKGLK